MNGILSLRLSKKVHSGLLGANEDSRLPVSSFIIQRHNFFNALKKCWMLSLTWMNGIMEHDEKTNTDRSASVRSFRLRRPCASFGCERPGREEVRKSPTASLVVIVTTLRPALEPLWVVDNDIMSVAIVFNLLFPLALGKGHWPWRGQCHFGRGPKWPFLAIYRYKTSPHLAFWE